MLVSNRAYCFGLFQIEHHAHHHHHHHHRKCYETTVPGYLPAVNIQYYHDDIYPHQQL
jgi:hypothetical protein